MFWSYKSYVVEVECGESESGGGGSGSGVKSGMCQCAARPGQPATAKQLTFHAEECPDVRSD